MRKVRISLLTAVLCLAFGTGATWAQQELYQTAQAVDHEVKKTKATLNQMVKKMDGHSFQRALPHLNTIKAGFIDIRQLNYSDIRQATKARLIRQKIDEIRAQLPKIARKVDPAVFGAVKKSLRKVNSQFVEFKHITEIAQSLGPAKSVLIPRMVTAELTAEEQASDIASKVVNILREKSTAEFAGVNWGVDVSLTLDTGKNGRVSEAVLVDTTVDGNAAKIVKVTKEQNDIARLMLETHYMFTPGYKFLWMIKKDEWGWGPFVGIEPGGGDIINAIGFGFMIGFKRPSPDGVTNKSFNMGFGAIVDPNTKILRDDFKENMIVSTSATAPEFRQTSQWGA